MTTSIQQYFQSKLPSYIYECLVYLEDQVEKNYFTSWSFANTEFQVSAFWEDEYCPQKDTNTQNRFKSIHPVFDLASLTKPLFLNFFLREKEKERFLELITKPICKVIDKNQLNNDELYQYIKAHPNLCLDSLLSHRSDLAPWCWMGYNQGRNDAKNEIIHHILTRKSGSSQSVYSDLNYYILARLIEALEPKIEWKQALDQLNSKHDTNFFHASISPEKSCLAIPYFPYLSVDSALRKPSATTQFGPAHDTNANILASLGTGKNIVSGHAGLFGNISDVVSLIPTLAETQFTYTKQANDISNSRFILGLDTNFGKENENIFGHLGYTGTSLWFGKKESVQNSLNFHILLTNRTAKRNLNSQKSKRIYLISDLQKNSLACVFKNGKDIDSLPYQNWFDELGKMEDKSELVWDSSAIQPPSDISQTRKFLAKKLWIL
jgi:hypothetical protein